jgi:molecular chaperone GrpE
LGPKNASHAASILGSPRKDAGGDGMLIPNRCLGLGVTDERTGRDRSPASRLGTGEVENKETSEDGGTPAESGTVHPFAEAGARPPANETPAGEHREAGTSALAARLKEAETLYAGARARVTDLETELAKARAEIARAVDVAKRAAADLDNARKRMDRERDEMRARATEHLVQRLLDVVANFDRALEAAGGDDAAHEGLTLIYRQFREVLAKEGVERIDTIGHPFDPAMHDAVMRESVPGYVEGTILSEFEPGWLLHGRVLRPAKVKVAAPSPPGPDDTPGTEPKED